MKTILILAISLLSVMSQANAIHLSGGFQGRPFDSDGSGVTLGVKYFFYEGKTNGVNDAYIGGLGIMTGPKSSALLSLTWMAFVFAPSWSAGVDIYVPVYNRNEDQGNGSLGISLNYAL